MSNWEDKYNKYKNGGIEAEIDKVINREVIGEYDEKEYEKLIKTEKNMPKVNHVVEYRDKLKREINELKEEFQTRKELVQASKKIEQLGENIDKLQKQSEELAKQLRDPKLTKEKRTEIQAKKDKIGPEIAKNQDAIQENENKLNSSVGTKRKLQNLSEEEIKRKMEDKSDEIKKCNFVANMLINGMDWDKINVKLDNWENKKFTDKDGKLKEIIEKQKDGKDKTIENIDKKREEKVNEFMKDYKPNFEKNDKKTEENKSKEENKDNHPKVAKKTSLFQKIGNFFKGMKDKFIKKQENKVTNTETKEPVKKGETVQKEESKNGVEKSFKERIREIAEKGMDGIEAEKAEEEAKRIAEEIKKAEMEKAARREAAYKKLEEWRGINRKNEEELNKKIKAENAKGKINGEIKINVGNDGKEKDQLPIEINDEEVR